MWFFEIRWPGQAAGRRWHVGQGLDEVRARCVMILRRVFQAKGKGRLRRRPRWQKQRVEDIMVDRLAWLDHKTSESTRRTWAFTLHKAGVQEDVSRGGIGA